MLNKYRIIEYMRIECIWLLEELNTYIIGKRKYEHDKQTESQYKKKLIVLEKVKELCRWQSVNIPSDICFTPDEDVVHFIDRYEQIDIWFF